MIRSIHLILISLTLFLLSGVAGPDAMAQGDSRTVEVILVKAGNDGEGIDSSLKPYASTLQRLFRFKSYTQSTRTTMRVSPDGKNTVSLAGGQTLSINGLSGSSKGMKADIIWSRGSKRLLQTRINLQEGSPAVLGGPRSKDGTWLLILTLR